MKKMMKKKRMMMKRRNWVVDGLMWDSQDPRHTQGAPIDPTTQGLPILHQRHRRQTKTHQALWINRREKAEKTY
jgi:hypothetical protein